MMNEFAIVEAMASEHAAPQGVVDELSRRPASPRVGFDCVAGAGCVLAELHGFDLEDRPLVRGIDGLPGEIVVARSTVALTRDLVGAQVVLAFERRDLRLPIVLGALRAPSRQQASTTPATVRIDDGERLVLRAERELVLQCGDASITLTRAGKVLIRGNYVSSQSSGYNRLKGAAIDIN